MEIHREHQMNRKPQETYGTKNSLHGEVVSQNLSVSETQLVDPLDGENAVLPLFLESLKQLH